MSLRQQLFKNIFSSWFGYAIRLIITFFFVPFIASSFGDARYGVWVIIFQTIGYFTMFDFGLNTALTRYVSKYLAEKDFNKINKILNSANLLYFFIGTLVLICVYLFTRFFFGYFEIGDPSLIEEGKSALLILGGLIAINFYFQSFGNTLAAFQRSDLERFVAIIEEILRVVIMVLLIKTGYGLPSLALTLVTTTVFRHIANILILKKLHPPIKFAPSDFDKDITKMLIAFSKISFGISIGWLIIFNTDTFLLGLLSSSAAAGIYSPASRLMLYLRNIVNTMSIPLIPAISHLETNRNIESVRRIYFKSIKYISYFSAVITLGVFIYGRSFARLWLPVEFEKTGDVMIVLAVGTLFFLPQIIGNSVLFGFEKHKHILRILILESALKIILAVALIPKYDIIGMAWANSIPQILIYPTIFPAVVSRVLKISFWKILFMNFKHLIAGGIITIVSSYILLLLISTDTWTGFALNVISVITLSLLPFMLIIESDDKESLKGFLKR